MIARLLKFACPAFFFLASMAGAANDVRQPVTVRVVPNSDHSIRVSYEFSQPVPGFRFEAHPGGLRESTWKSLSDKVVATSDGVVVTDGGYARTFVFDIAMPGKTVSRQYDSVLLFSDGGKAVYSEFLMPALSAWDDRFVLTPGKNAQVMVNGETSQQEIAWTDVARNAFTKGSYFYFGKLSVEKAGRFNYLMDPATPAWIAQEVVRLSNTLLENDYAKLKPGAKLQPLIMITRNGLEDAGYAYRGDTLSQQFIRLNFFGGGWEQRTEDKEEILRKFVAHELFHVWNAELSRPQEASAWLHEGAAEYMALRVLTDSKQLSEARALSSIANAVNACALGTADKTLRQIASGSQQQQLFYDCGLAFFFLLDSAVSTAHDGQAFYSLLGQLYAGESYSEDALFRLAGTMISPEVLDNIRAASATGVRPAPVVLRDALNRAGLASAYKEMDYPADFYQEKILASLLKMDCRDGVGYWTQAEGFKVDSGMQCKTLRNFPVLTQIAGKDLLRQPQQAFEVMRASCADGQGAIAYTAQDGSSGQVACTQRMDEVPARVEFMHMPGRRQ